MKQIYTLLLVLLVSCTTVFAQDNAKDKDIRELLRITKAGEIGIAAIKSNLDAMRKTNNTLPADVWTEFENAFTVKDIVDMTVPIYEKHFTHQEIKDMIALYKTPLGQKMLEKTPLVMQESMLKGQEYGREVGMRVLQKMKAEGRIPNN